MSHSIEAAEKIGFFDSGIGGLHILRHVIAELPEYQYVYWGDTENVPYGGKSDEEIYALSQRSLEALFRRDCRLVIFACNTASVTALRRLQTDFLPHAFPDRKILGVIIPTVETVLAVPETKTVALIGTEHTARSGKYESELKKLGSTVTMIAQPTPTLVPLIEAGEIASAAQAAIDIVRFELLPHRPDTLILGCTHYGLLKDALRNTFPTLRILAQEEIIPAKLAAYLHEHPEIETRLARKGGGQEIFLTKITPFYQSKTREWFGALPLNQATPSSQREATA